MEIKHKFKKAFGQNFLKSNKWPKKIVEIASPEKNQAIIEIGPGHGILTTELIKTGNKVYSFEIDTELLPFVLNKFSNNENFQLINQNILDVNFNDDFKDKDYIVCASLPYNISKKIIANFLLSKNPPKKMVFIIQKEVAENYVFAEDSAFLSMFAGIYSDVKMHNIIKASEFHPMPKVDGAIIEFSNIKPKYENAKELVGFIRSGFSQPRKKVSVNLSNIKIDKNLIEEKLIEFGLTNNARPSELNLEMWYKLFQLNS